MVYLTQLLPSHSYPIRRQMRIAINAAVVSPNTSRQEAAGKIRSQAGFRTALSVCAAQVSEPPAGVGGQGVQGTSDIALRLTAPVNPGPTPGARPRM